MMDVDDSLERLDPAVIRLWRIQMVITMLIIAVAALVPVGILTYVGVIPSIVPVCLIVAGVIAISIYACWFAGVAFGRWSYCMHKKGTVQIRRGVIFTREIHIPLGRVQHVDIEQGPLERHLGIMRLILFTAGTKNARQVIPGLPADLAEAFRDQLTRMANQQHRHDA